VFGVVYACVFAATFGGSSVFGASAASASYAYAYQYLTVYKHVINNDGGNATAAQWLLHVKSAGSEVAGSPGPGSETGTTYSLAPGTYSVVESGGPSGYFFAGYSLDCNSSGVVSFSATDAYKSCKLTNNDGGPLRSPGYWKNHLNALAPLLPVSLGNYSVSSGSAAAGVFDAMTCGNSKSANAAGCLAGELLAAKLNVANGTSICIAQTISQADSLLVSIGYGGPGPYALTPAQRALAVSLANTLDRYNAGKGC
jgi:hypothetical protein